MCLWYKATADSRGIVRYVGNGSIDVIKNVSREFSGQNILFYKIHHDAQY